MASTERLRPTFISSIIYRDNRAALAWLERSFGFEPIEVLTDADDNIVHAEMTYGDGVIMVGSQFADWTKSPLDVDGKNTQRLHVRVDGDIDAHCEHARQAGAKIVMEPDDQFYGDRTYMAEDLEGHHWTFAKPVRQVTNDEMEQATGFKIKQRP